MDNRTADFDFDLPQERIAQHPVKPRDSARLLDVPCEPGMPLADRHVRDLPGLLRAGDLLVANDTAVIPAQLHARRGEAKIGVTLDQHQADGSWSALIKNAKRLRVGDELTFPGASDDTAAVVSLDGEGGATLQFSCEGEAFDAFLRTAGALALPPYIARPEGPTAEDERDYRTIFAEHKGAVAAPTAGLHFTPELLARLDEAGIGRETLTLHVGAGTFLPVRSETLSAHKMHAERGIITQRVADRINETRARGGRIVAVGTTSLRLLESAATEDGRVMPFDGDTSIFIHPGYRFRAVDLLMTNFHLPRSTLFMLVCAFAGTERMRAAYAHAVADGYRFYSYGDACLLRRAMAE